MEEVKELLTDIVLEEGVSNIILEYKSDMEFGTFGYPQEYFDKYEDLYHDLYDKVEELEKTKDRDYIENIIKEEIEKWSDDDFNILTFWVYMLYCNICNDVENKMMDFYHKYDFAIIEHIELINLNVYEDSKTILNTNFEYFSSPDEYDSVLFENQYYFGFEYIDNENEEQSESESDEFVYNRGFYHYISFIDKLLYDIHFRELNNTDDSDEPYEFEESDEFDEDD